MFPNPVPLPNAQQDPFAPVLYGSKAVEISADQESAVRRLLLLTSADTDFAQKAANALRIILGGGVNGGKVPVITSLEPATGVINTANLKIKAKGTDFEPGATIYMNGNPMPTTFTSATEVSTTVTLPATPQSINVIVRNATGAFSNQRTFTVTSVLVQEEAEPAEPTQEGPLSNMF